MTISIFDLFSVGIGPSSSHTVGPMRAASLFARQVSEGNAVEQVQRVTVDLYGSLAFTGIGHGTDRAILLGLEGNQPETVEPELLTRRADEIWTGGTLQLGGTRPVPYAKDDMQFVTGELLPQHSNGMRFRGWGASDEVLEEAVYYSIGGGFVVDAEGNPPKGMVTSDSEPPYPFRSAAQLRAHCDATGKTVAEIMWANELAARSDAEIQEGLTRIWDVMQASIQRGLETEGELPGGLEVRRRSPGIYRKLQEKQKVQQVMGGMDWLSVYAIAVNEENAAGGRVVTAPTNGAAGIIPAVLYYYTRHINDVPEQQIFDYLLTASAIGILYKHGASISAAEVGCQGEVGVACSMAAGGYAALIGGNTAQIENAAEMGMEHNLGLTCDPIGGLVQIPCIERNAMGAVKAVACAKLALNEEGTNKVTLDKVIATMLQTGKDMMTAYKETSQGGLAVSMPEC